MKFIKLYSFCSMFFLLTLYGCGKSNEPTGKIDNNKTTVEVPAFMKNLSFATAGTLRAYITIDGDTENKILMDLDLSAKDGTASVSIPGLSFAAHTIMISYEYTVGDNIFMLASAIQNIDLTSGSSDLSFATDDYDQDSFNYNGDGENNLEELLAGTDPGVRSDTTTPIFNSASSISVAENKLATGYIASATDVGGADLVYSLVGGIDAEMFSINSSTGEIRFKNAAKFDAPVDSDKNNIYLLGIKVSDGINLAAQSLTITVTHNTHFTVTPQRNSAELSWNQPGAESYNLYYSSEKGFDIENYANFNEGNLLTNVASPLTVKPLVNGRAYYFVLETIFPTKTTLSAQTAARPNELIFNASVTAMAIATDKTLYLGGGFTSVGAFMGGGIPLNKETGKPLMGDFPLVTGNVNASVSDGQGGWYLGGNFNNVGGVVRNNLAHILADGTVDEDWNPDANGIVSALSVSGNTVYVGGGFSGIGGQKRNRLAAIGIDGVLSDWNPAANSTVQTLLVSGNTVYVGGIFSTIGGVTRSRLAAIGTNGVLSDWNPGVDLGNDFSGGVRALSILGNTVYVGGDFKTAGGKPRNCLAAIGIDGTLRNWDPDVGRCIVVNTLSISGNTVYVGGAFSTIGGTKRNNVAAIGTDGVLNIWNPDADNTVNTLFVLGNIVYLGGRFTSVGGTTRNRLAAITKDGVLNSWNPSVNEFVRTLSISGNSVYAGGSFNTLNPVIRNRLASIDADGTLSAWNPDANGAVNTLSVSGSTVYAGGGFTKIGEATRNNLAAIGTDGVLNIWNPDADNTVNTLFVSGSTVYVGGNFSTVGNVERSRLAAIGIDGVLGSWDPVSDANVSALTVADDIVYVGGSFLEIAGEKRNHLAAIRVNGVLSNWDPDAGSSSSISVNTLAVSRDTVYAAGNFTIIGGSKRNGLMAIGTNGKLSNWSPNLNTDARAGTLLISGSTVYVGGSFEAIDEITRNNLAAIDTDGSLSSWNPDASNVAGVLLVTDDSIYVGGIFTTIGGIVRSGFAEIDTDGLLK